MGHASHFRCKTSVNIRDLGSNGRPRRPSLLNHKVRFTHNGPEGECPRLTSAVITSNGTQRQIEFAALS